MLDPVLRERVDRVKAANRIEAVAAELGLALKKKGRSLFFRCINPAHEDSDPSCSISVEKQGYHCFGCEASGDVITLVQAVRGCSFAEALAWLDDRTGSAPPSSQATERTGVSVDEAFADPDTARLLERVADHWAKTLYRTAPGRRYLKARGLEDPELAKRFRIGYCDGRLSEIVSEDERKVLQAVGVLNEKGNSSFYKAITVPILGDHRLAVGFYGRRIAGKGHLGLVGGHRDVFNARAWYEGDEVVLTEGPLDALSVFAAGVRNVSCLYGVNGWTSHHDRHLREGSVRSVVLALDNDGPGRDAAERLGVELSGRGLRVRRVLWPEGAKDANDLLRMAADGKEQIRRLVEGAPTVAAAVKAKAPAPIPVKKEEAAPPPAVPPPPEANGNGTHPRGETIEIGDRTALFAFNGISYSVRGISSMTSQSLRVRIDATSHGKKHTDRLELATAKSRTAYARGAEKTLGVQAASVEVDLARILEEIEAWQKARQEAAADAAREPMSRGELEVALAFLRSPDLLDRIAEDLTAVGYVGEDVNKRLLYLIATSRKLDYPLAALIKGPSSAGKSQLMEYVAFLMPGEDVLYFSRISPQALFYMPRDGLVHKLLIIDERDGSAEADYSIRTLLTRRRLSLAVVMRDPSGTSQTRIFEIDGPISYMESTTTEDLNPENENRAFLLFVDDSSAQTEKIHQAQKAGYSIGQKLGEDQLEEIRRRHHNAQRLLERAPVAIPFADKIRFPADQVRARRDHQRFLSLIGTVAFLHQHQREWKTDAAGVRWIVASPADYRIAYGLALQGLAGGLDELPPPAAAAYQLLREHVHREAAKAGLRPADLTWSRSEVIDWTGLSMTSARRLLARLVDHELVEQSGGGQKGTICRYRLTERKPREGKVLEVTPPDEIDL